MNELFDYEKERLLNEFSSGVNILNPICKIIYVTSDGRKFEDKIAAEKHDKIISRQMYYEYLIKNRNWIQRLFNIKPSMKFYDE